MDWLKSYFKKEEKVSAQKAYDELFDSFWKEHADKVLTMYDNLETCVEIKNWTFVFTHNGEKQKANVKQCISGVRPCIKIYFEMQFKSNMEDDFGKDCGITQTLSKYGEIKISHSEDYGNPYDINLRIRSLKDGKCLKLILLCWDD